LLAHSLQTFDISFTAAGDYFCIANSGGKVLVRPWASLLAGSSSGMDVDDANPAEPERPWEIDAQMGSCNALRFTRDGRYMATAGTDAIVNLWSTDEFIALKSFGDMRWVKPSLALRLRLVMQCADSSSIRPRSGEVKQLAFSNSGELLAAGGEESAVYLVRAYVVLSAAFGRGEADPT
jgi:WD40 repeat protein